MVLIAAARVGLSARLDSVRPAADALRRHDGHPHDRLGQYRRHQRAAHRPQGSRGRDPAARRAEGHGRGAARGPLLGRRSRRSPRPAAPFAATSCRSGCAFAAARASRRFSAACSACSGRPGWSSRRSGSRWPSCFAIRRLRRWSRACSARRRCSLFGQPRAAVGVSRCSRWSSGGCTAPTSAACWPARKAGSARRRDAGARAARRRASGSTGCGSAAPTASARAPFWAAAAVRQRRGGARACRLGAAPARRRGWPTATRCCGELAAGTKRGLRFVGLTSRTILPALRAIDSAPPLIAVRGRPADPAAQPMVAIVGSRNASAAGPPVHRAARRGARGRGYRGRLGPRARHRRAGASGDPATGTVAVLAGGHDRIYPREHADLAARIAETGAVVSEMPLGWEPRGRDFPRRNRIVSGLASATVVVEAARRSGSLITARFANEQGREVFAVPGSPLDPRAEGTNDLLRQGATLCTTRRRRDRGARGPSTPPSGLARADAWPWSGDDVAGRRRAGLLRQDRRPRPSRIGAGRAAALLGPSPIAFDDLVRLSGLGAAQVRSAAARSRNRRLAGDAIGRRRV